MRRLSSRPGFVPAGLSRVKFLGGTAALLAGCSAGRALPPLGGSLGPHSTNTNTKVLNLSSKEMPARPKRKTGIVVSTSASGKAVAAHDSHGKFLMSLAMGPASLRARTANGQTFVFSSNFPIANAVGKPTFLSTGHVVRFKQSPSNGRMYMRLQDGAGPTAFHIPNTTFALEDNGSVTVFKGRGKSAKPYANTGAPRKLHGKADIDALLAALVDRPGAWTADDDFVGAEGPPDEGFTGTRPAKAVGKRSLGTRRTLGDTAGCTATDTTTSSPFTYESSSFNSGSFGSSGFNSTGENAIEDVRRASAERRASRLSSQCAWLLADMVVGLAAMGLSSWTVLGGCLTPLAELSLGSSCFIALAGLALSYYGYLRGATGYLDANCPLPAGMHRP